MQMIEFQISLIWKQKFVELRAGFENIGKDLLKRGVTEINENKVLRT